MLMPPFAAAGRNILNGNNTFTVTASDSLGRQDTNSVTQNLPSSVSLAYDANGNLTADGSRTFVYDQENQLTSVTVTNAAASTSTKTDFVYDGLNRMRIKREWVWNARWQQTTFGIGIRAGGSVRFQAEFS